MRIELPGDQWADLKDDPADLTGEDEVIVRSALKLQGKQGDDGFEASAGGPVQMEFAMLARVITAWSLPQPVNVANIRALSLRQLRPLRKAIEPFMLEMREDRDPNPAAGNETG